MQNKLLLAGRAYKIVGTILKFPGGGKQFPNILQWGGALLYFENVRISKLYFNGFAAMSMLIFDALYILVHM